MAMRQPTCVRCGGLLAAGAPACTYCNAPVVIEAPVYVHPPAVQHAAPLVAPAASYRSPWIMWAISLVVMLGVAGMSMFLSMRRSAAIAPGGGAPPVAGAPLALHAMTPPSPAPVVPPTALPEAAASPPPADGRDIVAIRAVIAAHRDDVAACVKGAPLKASLALTISARGKVTRATVTDAGAAAPCLTRAARRWTFPRGPDELRLTVPLVVTP